GIRWFLLSPAGAVVLAGAASASPGLHDEFDPSCAMSPDGTFVVAWVRGNPLGGPTNGVWLRRFGPAGAPLDASEAAGSNPSSNFGSQRETAVALGASGRGIIVWTDGTMDAPASAPSPDGHGSGILMAFWTPAFAIQGSYVATGTIVA